MALYLFRLPDIGEGVAEAEIAAWHVKPGDEIKEDQTLVDVVTDKATVDMPSPVAGRVIATHGAPGERVAVGSTLVELDVRGDQDKPAPSAPLAAPATRKLARDLGVSLEDVGGGGPEGRITESDVKAHAAGRAAPPAARDDAEGVRERKIIGLRRAIAETMQTALRIPHFSYVEEFDMTALEALRAELNQGRTRDQPKLTPLAFFMRAIVALRRDFPHVNARFDAEAGVLREYDAVHIGIATQTPRGLVVPVVRDAHQRDIWDCAGAVAHLTEAVRDGRAGRDELTGATITITSLGALGGVAATPVINPPEVAIICPNRMTERPVVHDGQVVIRTMMNLSTSFDHRIVDGHDAARFVQAMKRLIEQPALIFVPR